MQVLMKGVNVLKIGGNNRINVKITKLQNKLQNKIQRHLIRGNTPTVDS